MTHCMKMQREWKDRKVIFLVIIVQSKAILRVQIIRSGHCYCYYESTNELHLYCTHICAKNSNLVSKGLSNLFRWRISRSIWWWLTCLQYLVLPWQPVSWFWQTPPTECGPWRQADGDDEEPALEGWMSFRYYSWDIMTANPKVC